MCKDGPPQPRAQLPCSCSIDTNYTKNDKGDYELVITNTASSSGSSKEVVWKSETTMIVINPQRERGGGSSKPAVQVINTTRCTYQCSYLLLNAFSISSMQLAAGKIQA
jgi:hypothetical protein